MKTPNSRSKSFDFSGFSSPSHPSKIQSNRQRLLDRLMSNNQHLQKKYSQTHQRNKTIAYHDNQENYSTESFDKGSNNQTTLKQNIESRIHKYKTNFDKIEQDEQEYKQNRTLKLPYLKKPKNKKYYFNRYAKLNDTEQSILLNYLNAKFNSKLNNKRKAKLKRNSNSDLIYLTSQDKKVICSPQKIEMSKGIIIQKNKKNNKDKIILAKHSLSKQRIIGPINPRQKRHNPQFEQNVYIINQKQRINQKLQKQNPHYYAITQQYQLKPKKRRVQKNYHKMGLINLYKVDKKGDIKKIDIIAPVQTDNSKLYQKTCDPSINGHCTHDHNYHSQKQQGSKSRVNSRLSNNYNTYQIVSPQNFKKKASRSVNKFEHHYIIQQESNRDWQQVNYFDLKTYYAKLKDKNSNQNSYPATSMIKINDFVKIPSNENLSDFIQNYHPINADVDLFKLIKQPSFQVQFQEDTELYFGQTLKGKKHGTGILLRKHYIFQGEYLNNQKRKGIQITDVGMYNGSFFNQQRDGYGEFKWNNGQYYNGEWKNGKKHGSGMWSSKKGDSYIGEWNFGKVQGHGVHTTAKKQKYQGEFVNFLKHGWGKQILPNGDVYQGNFYQGTPHGKGRYAWAQGHVYQGQFLKSIRTGIGILKTKQGSVYQGHFNEENAQGLCQIIYQNGDIYKGVLKNGKRNGRGTLKRKKEKQIWDGFWRDNQFIEPLY